MPMNSAIAQILTHVHNELADLQAFAIWFASETTSSKESIFHALRVNAQGFRDDGDEPVQIDLDRLLISMRNMGKNYESIKEIMDGLAPLMPNMIEGINIELDKPDYPQPLNE